LNPNKKKERRGKDKSQENLGVERPSRNLWALNFDRFKVPGFFYSGFFVLGSCSYFPRK
jgi:hypothetical protein